MENVKKIQYIRELEIERAKLQSKLGSINTSISKEQSCCSHVFVGLTKYMSYGSYRCIMCGMEVNCANIGTQYVVRAENYLLQYNVLDAEQRATKFDHVRTLALGLLKDKPDMSRSELVAQLNNLICESISIRDTQVRDVQGKLGVVKTIGQRK